MSGPGVSLGLSGIVVLYATIGLLAAIGSTVVFRRTLGQEREQLGFAAFLAPIAGFYLAFVAYFEAASSWTTEASAVLVFGLLALLGLRYRAALAMGYALHGLWDILHELNAHGLFHGLAPGRLTEIPLAYGVFCLAYDLAVAAYFARLPYKNE